MTDVVRVDQVRPDPAAIARAAECLRSGGLVAFPTETVYGLGVHALDRAAVRRLFAAKGRPATDPLIVHVGSLANIAALVVDVPDAARALAARFWPGPLTLVLPRSPLVPDEVTAGLETVAVRVPAHPVAQALLVAAGIPVAAPSANLFSRPSPTRAAHVLTDLNGRIDLIVDGGPTTVGVESTVLDLSQGAPTVLRPGAITIEMIREVLPRVEARAPIRNERGAMPSPGLLSKHYSPRAPLTLYEGAAREAIVRLIDDAGVLLGGRESVGIIAADEDREALQRVHDVEGSRVEVRYLGSERDAAAIASRLYAVLRDLDASGVDQILVRGFPADGGLGIAIQDRLRRAASVVLGNRVGSE
ncbi:MAG TPA: L-threonylcarbamoyladenylate synthase [Vicinamibacterales bacterium]|nr:L-threonylcarbamoyladenylate synthase [Vicinamibacterales bacterium]